MSASSDLLMSTESGLYCPAGDFYVDPWRPVARAIITHAHADHARPGSSSYLTSRGSRHVLQARLGADMPIETLGYGEQLSLGSTSISFHPAGHVLGSAQVRIEHRGEVWVISGDYKLDADRTCQAFEPVSCHTFITESTFGLPIFRWTDQEVVFAEINAWWQSNAEHGRVSVLYAYSLGKAQRVIGGVEPSIGPIYCHGAVERLNEEYRRSGVGLPPTHYAGEFDGRGADQKRALIIAPPLARGTPWLRRFGDYSSGFASGWMQIRGPRRRRSVERGFVLSDHADWPGLIAAIRATGASRVLVTHGSVGPMVRWLNEQGWNAGPLHTEFEGEQDEVAEPAESEHANGHPSDPTSMSGED